MLPSDRDTMANPCFSLATMKVPVSPYLKIEGIVYLMRMFDKVRLHAAGHLREDLQSNLGIAMDAWSCEFLGVTYENVVGQVNAGLTDEEVVAWCFENGKKPSPQEIKVWNGYMARVGWRDHLTEKLTQRKTESGFAEREDIQSMFDYIDADEGRTPGSL